MREERVRYAYEFKEDESAGGMARLNGVINGGGNESMFERVFV